jgi:hypothetical protein
MLIRKEKIVMKFLKFILIVSIMVLLTGCGKSYYWHVEKHVETPEEAALVAAQEKDIIAELTKHDLTLSGHDQDWDDTITAVHNAAIETYCKSRMYEYVRDNPVDAFIKSGRIKDIVIEKQ